MAVKGKKGVKKGAKGAKGAKGKKGKKGSKKSVTKFHVDCSVVVNDGIFDVAAFVDFLKKSIKVNGKAGQLGNAISVESAGSTVYVTANNVPFAKRYLKMLTKKYLKKQQIRDWLRVIADSKVSYKLKYFVINESDDEQDDDDAMDE